MKLRSKLFVVTVALLAAVNFIALATDCQNVYAQANTGKKTTNKAVEKADTILVTFVEIGAAKCIPCKAMQPIMREIAAEFEGQVQVVFYDVWKNPEPGRKYGIQLIPTQVFVDKTGKEIFRHMGLFPKDELVAFLKKQGVR